MYFDPNFNQGLNRFDMNVPTRLDYLYRPRPSGLYKRQFNRRTPNVFVPVRSRTRIGFRNPFPWGQFQMTNKQLSRVVKNKKKKNNSKKKSKMTTSSMPVNIGTNFKLNSVSSINDKSYHFSWAAQTVHAFDMFPASAGFNFYFIPLAPTWSYNSAINNVCQIYTHYRVTSCSVNLVPMCGTNCTGNLIYSVYDSGTPWANSTDVNGGSNSFSCVSKSVNPSYCSTWTPTNFAIDKKTFSKEMNMSAKTAQDMPPYLIICWSGAGDITTITQPIIDMDVTFDGFRLNNDYDSPVRASTFSILTGGFKRNDTVTGYGIYGYCVWPGSQYYQNIAIDGGDTFNMTQTVTGTGGLDDTMRLTVQDVGVDFQQVTGLTSVVPDLFKCVI